MRVVAIRATKQPLPPLLCYLLSSFLYTSSPSPVSSNPRYSHAQIEISRATYSYKCINALYLFPNLVEPPCRSSSLPRFIVSLSALRLQPKVALFACVNCHPVTRSHPLVVHLQLFVLKIITSLFLLFLSDDPIHRYHRLQQWLCLERPVASFTSLPRRLTIAIGSVSS